MAGDKTYITDSQGKQHRATRVHAVTPTDIVWSSNPNDYTVQVKIGGKWHRAVLTMDAGTSTFFDNINIDKALVTGADGKQHTALIVKPESTVTLSDIKTDTHGTIAGTTTGETAVSTYSENWSDVKWQDNVNVYKVLVTGSDGKVHTALLTTSSGGGGGVQVIVLGPSPLSLPDAIADSLTYVKAFGGTEQWNIPQPYTQVNYVTNTAQTAVNTGIMIDFAKNYEFEVECRAVSGSWYILQSRASASGNVTGIHGETSGSNIKLVVGNVTICTSAITRTVGNKLYVKATLNAGTATLYVKDETANTEDTQTGSYGTTQPNPTAAVYLLGNAGEQYVDVNSDIYMARIKENGVTVMDYVPARQVATAGFYDTVSGTFKTALTPANLSADGNTVPTPDAPMDIVSNNGVLKLSPNLVDFNEVRINGTTWASADKTKGFEVEASIYGKDVGSSVISNANCFGVFVPCKQGKSVSINFFDYTVYGARCFYCEVDADGKATTTPVQYATMHNVLAQQTFTITQSNSIGFVIEWYISSSQVRNYTKENYMVVRGATPPTAYIPYGAIYTDGTVETIQATGKNLFDKDSTPYRGGYITAATIGDSSFQVSANSNYNIYRIDIQPNTTYTFGIIKANAPYWVVTDDAGVILDAHTNGGGTGGVNITITTPANAKYLYLSVGVAGTYKCDDILQLELGSTATEYEPYYNGGTATAEMLLKVGDYQDVQSIIDGAVTRRVGAKVLDGTENWEQTSSYTGPWVFSTIFDDGKTGAETLEKVCCTHFQGVAVTNPEMPPESAKITVQTIAPNISRFYVKTNVASSVANWKAWLVAQYAAGTPVIVVYPLATPTTESVTGQALQVTGGDNVLEITQASLSGLELEAEYTKVA